MTDHAKRYQTTTPKAPQPPELEKSSPNGSTQAQEKSPKFELNLFKDGSFSNTSRDFALPRGRLSLHKKFC